MKEPTLEINYCLFSCLSVATDTQHQRNSMDLKEATFIINNAAAPSVTKQLVKVEVKVK